MKVVDKMIKLLLKRFIDIVVSIVAVLLFSPLFLIIPLLIIIEDGLPVLFIQERAGLSGKSFNIYKFRTMRITTDDMTVSDIDRILKIGAWLRSTGLDELPQFFNIIKGEMSIVGPRPTLLSQVEQYDNNQFKRLSMKPGVTGWTAINEGHNSSWDERIAMDLWYVDNFSIGLDILIILKTPLVMLLGRPAYFDQASVEAAASSDIKDE